MKRRDWLLAIVLLGVIGLAISLYDVAHLWGERESFCDLSSMLSCSAVNTSRWARLFTVRVAAYGAFAYGALLLSAAYLLVAGMDRRVRLLMSLLAAAATLFSLYLTGIEAIVLRTWCPTCVVSQLSIAGILLACWFLFTKEERASLLARARTPRGLASAAGFVAFALLAVHLAYALCAAIHPPSPDSGPGPGVSGEFAQCLTEKGVVMYGSMYCPHCASQKTAFGPAWKNVTYVECGVEGRPLLQAEACRQERIGNYPTWEFADGTRLIGETPFSILAAGSGCPLP